MRAQRSGVSFLGSDRTDSGQGQHSDDWRSALATGKDAVPGNLAGCTVTMCEHLDGTVSVRWGPHLLQRFDAEGRGAREETNKSAVEKAGAWKPAKTKNRFPPAPTTPLEISPTTRDSHFPTASTTAVVFPKRNRKTKAAHAA